MPGRRSGLTRVSTEGSRDSIHRNPACASIPHPQHSSAPRWGNKPARAIQAGAWTPVGSRNPLRNDSGSNLAAFFQSRATRTRCAVFFGGAIEQLHIKGRSLDERGTPIKARVPELLRRTPADDRSRENGI